jgi:hypothetical protein
MAQKGNAVVLVAGTMFVGYLYLTGRLQKVIQVLAEPAPGAEGQPLATSSPGESTPASPGAGPRTPRATWESGGPLMDAGTVLSGGVAIPTSRGTYTPPAPIGGTRNNDPFLQDPKWNPPKWRGDPSGYERRQ